MRHSRHSLGLIVILLADAMCGASPLQSEPRASASRSAGPETREATEPSSAPDPDDRDNLVPGPKLTPAERACMPGLRDLGQLCRELGSVALLQGTWCGLWGSGFTIEGDGLTEWRTSSGWQGRITIRRDEMPGWLDTVVVDSDGKRVLFGPVRDPCLRPWFGEGEALVYGRGHAAPALYYRVSGRDCSCLAEARANRVESERHGQTDQSREPASEPVRHRDGT